MKKITKVDEIIEKIKNGISRDELESEYNKGTVTKAYNKIQELKEVNNRKEVEVKNIILDLFSSIDKSEEYEITINISKKIKNKSIKENTKSKAIENPFEMYNSLGKKEYLKKLNKTKSESLQRIIKKYFSLSKNEINKYTIDKLANYIINEVERNLNIGECFK